MAADIPTNEPVKARAGDTWKWTRTLDDYPATTWTLKYRFKHPTASGFEVIATASGTDHSVTVAATSTTSYTAGKYTWIAWVEAGTEKFTVDQGELEIQPEYRTASAATVLDERSHARKTLEALEAWIEARDVAVAEYEIAGRRMKYIPIPELIKLRQIYKREVEAENASAAIARGEGVGRRIQFRM